MAIDVRSRTAKGLEVIAWSAPTVEENLAMDEKLASEAARDDRRVLRLWWGSNPTCVLGCADKAERVLDLEACGRFGIGIARRVTGGSAVVQTSGVFNYSYTAPDAGRLDISRTFKQGAELVIRALSSFGIEAGKRGISDVAVADRKISGNAQARKWRAILFHGTLLVDIDRTLMEAVLKHPAEEPDYRMGRTHAEFITTLKDLGIPSDRDAIKEAFAMAATEVFET